MKTDQKRIEPNIFLDSGAHSLYTKHVINKQHTEGYNFYETDTFWKYVDSYGKYMSENKDKFEIYVNIDVIFNPEMSWKVQQYLESNFGLNPMPVVHYGTDLKWLRFYMDNYEYIGIGGLGQEVSVSQYLEFGDAVFKTAGDKNGVPTHKLHGFAITAPTLMFRYPWYSVDSATWIRVSRMGMIMIPRIQYGKTRWNIPPVRIQVSDKGPQKSQADTHIDIMSANQRKRVISIIEEKGFKLGKSIEENGIMRVVEPGLINNYKMRDIFNMLYMQELESFMTPWPWAFKMKNKQSTLL
jgi:hypothetical protein